MNETPKPKNYEYSKKIKCIIFILKIFITINKNILKNYNFKLIKVYGYGTRCSIQNRF